MNNFRTFQAAVEFYRLSKTLPLRGTLKEQFSRAAPSIALNLAEARGRSTQRDQMKFFHVAFGSARECQAILILAELEGTQAWEALDKLLAHLYKLIH